MTRIYIALSTFSKESPRPLEVLKASGFSFDINTSGKRMTKAEVMEKVRGYDGVVAGLEPYDAEVLKALPGLKCISRCGVGTDNVDKTVAAELKVKVLNTPQVVVQPVAELTVAMIFDLLRRVTEHTELMRRHEWNKLTGRQLAGKTVGLIGVGRIGRRVAELLVALGAKVIACDRAPDAAWAKNLGVEIVELKELLAAADIVSLHLAQCAEACLKLSKSEFDLMKPGAFFVNVARGVFVDEQALADVLKNGRLAGAALDVFDREPYSGPLCDLPNVLLTPHIATLTEESRAQMELEAVENIIRFFKGGANA